MKHRSRWPTDHGGAVGMANQARYQTAPRLKDAAKRKMLSPTLSSKDLPLLELKCLSAK